MDGELRREWRSLRTATPMNIAIWAVCSVGLLVWRLIEGDSLATASLLASCGLVLGVAMAPLLWLRYDRDHRSSGRTTLKVFGLALLYLAVLLGGIVGLLALLG